MDGLLQLQPGMFTMNMITGVIKPTVVGQPFLVAQLINWATSIVSPHLIFFNWLVAAVQLLIGVLLILDVTHPLVLFLALLWPALVWVFGEGLGQVLTGKALVMTGAPGAVALYGAIALIAWPFRKPGPRQGLPSRKAALWVLVCLWVLGAMLQLQPTFLYKNGLSGAILGLASGQPRWLASSVRWAGHLVAIRGGDWSLGLAAWQATIAALLLARKKLGLVLSTITALAFWWFGQAFGSMFTGMGTDPNSGPLIVLLAFVLYQVDKPTEELEREPRRVRRSSVEL